MNIRTLIGFMIITFGMAWTCIAVLIVFPEFVVSYIGEIHAANPLFMLAVYSPAIAAIIVVGKHGGIPGLKAFFSRILLWKAHWGWYVFLILGIPCLFYMGAALKGNLIEEFVPDLTVGEAVSAIAFMLILGPMEEFGWRGVALPLLQKRLYPFWAGILLGGIWGIWHLPAFFLSGVPQNGWTFLPFLAGAMSIGVIVTPLFNSSRGSILLPFLFHWQLNNPLFPDAAPHDTLFFVQAALLVTVVYWKQMFNFGSVVTEPIPKAIAQTPENCV